MVKAEKEDTMADETKVPVTKGSEGSTSSTPSASSPSEWRPFDSLHREVERRFDDFGRGWGWSPFRSPMFGMEPFGRRELTWGRAPVVDVAERENEYEITAELPGMEEKDIELTVSDDVLKIKGERKEEKEEKNKDYHISERRYGSYQRSFRLPEGVDDSKIEAKFKNGLLTVTLPKTAEAQKKSKKIEVKKG
jgi:HSP20 family protein